MDLVNLLRLIRRQRVVVGILVVASIGALVYLYISIPVTYRASGSAVLLKPSVTAPPLSTPGATVPAASADNTNPYVSLNDMSVVLDIVSRRMKTPSVETRLDEQGVSSFTLGANLDFYRGPILDYSADGGTQAAALRGAGVVRAEIQQQLDELQAQQGVAPADYIRLDDAVTATDTTTVITSKVRTMIGAGFVCAVIVLGAALLADARRKRLAETSAELPAQPPTPLAAPGTFQIQPLSAAAETPAAPEFREPSYWSAQR